MKIAMVSEHASPLAPLGGVDAGGQNVHVAELAAGLSRLGHDVRVYTRCDDAELPPEVIVGAGYRVVHVPAGPARHLPKDEILPYLGEFAAFLHQQWAADLPDVVHAHFWMSGVAAENAARDLEVPVVLTFHALGTVKRRHQGLADTSPRSRIGFERAIAAHATHIIATCSDEVHELAKMGVPVSRTSVVPCGVDLSMFTPDGPAEEPECPHRIVSVGRMVPRKGFDTAIAALSELPDTELVVAGGSDCAEDEAEQDRLRKIAAKYDVSHRVRFRGPVPRAQMPALLRSADVVVCTPWYEPFGIVPLEAMSCAKPVVATAVGGMLDTVLDGVTGRLVPSGDPAALAGVLAGLLAQERERQTMGEAGLQRARSRYSWDRVSRDTSAAYRRATATAGAGGGIASSAR
ncbi:glycosyltransferase [Nocardia veterana]|uniref:Glycosyltransferase family 1 protein n=1 Tax=Nocardia veterana TaxID=132249 RepID=A0A7X6LZA3_9NOCA|nr:glycosyltransferase [Nocardia veterana]NKY87369.1 glycosyltransferase family 1 protein [Nocardia veterana]